MAPVGWMCVAVTAGLLLVHSLGQETGLVGEKSRPVRTVGAPPEGKCVHITGGGVSGVHFYVCCNNCNENNGNPTCDRTTYHGASSGQYCGHCGADEGNGKLDLRNFQCGGCAGQTQVDEKCHKKYPWLFFGTCWVFSLCFQLRCENRFQQMARNLDSDAPFCGDDTCDPGETAATCPFDCCPVTNPDTCARNGRCTPRCCSESSCCSASGSPNIKGGKVVILAAIGALAFTFNWLFN